MTTPEEIRFPHAAAPAEGEAMEVAPGILWMRVPLPMALDHVNIYALDEGDSWTVVDTGFKSRRSIAIWEGLLSGPLGGRPVSRIIMTHHHPDHVGMVGWLQARFGAEVVATRTAWLMARMLTLDVQDSLSAEALTFYIRAGMPPAILAERRQNRPFNFADVVHPIPLGYRRIRDGEAIRFGGRNWRIREGNGHAPEHATFWAEEESLVIAGDQILPGISSHLGVYPTEPDADPVGPWIESCRELRRHARPDHLVLPGHKLPFTGLKPRLTQLIDNHHGALSRLLEHLHTPRTAADCFLPLFKRNIGESEVGLALAESVGHLNHLLVAGKVSRRLRADGAYAWKAR